MRPSKVSPHAVLGVEPHADRETVRTAYRALAKRWHPDRAGSDPHAARRFAEIREAYRVLTETAGDGPHARGSGAPRGRAGDGAATRTPDANERMMEHIFGEAARAWLDETPPLDAAQTTPSGAPASRPRPAPRTPDADVARGGAGAAGRILSGLTALLTPLARAAMPALAGRPGFPAADTAGAVDPPAAAGTGTGTSRTSASAANADDAPCAGGAAGPTTTASAGAVAAPADPVRELAVPLSLVVTGGTLEATVDERPHAIAIAAGTPDGTILRLDGDRAGDSAVLVRLRHRGDDGWRSEGADLHGALCVPLALAVIGGQTTLDTPGGGRLAVTVPAWSGSDRVLRLRGRGLLQPHGEGRGDLYVHVRIVLPPEPDERLTDLMRVMTDGLYL